MVTGAKTHTHSKTHARSRLIQMQVRAMLRRATGMSSTRLNELLIGVKEKWLNKFAVYAMNGAGLCCAELSLTVDWNEHGLQVKLGHSDVPLPSGWEQDTAIEVDEAVSTFLQHVQESQLKTEWAVFYSDHVTSDSALLSTVRTKLNLGPSSIKKWAGARSGVRDGRERAS